MFSLCCSVCDYVCVEENDMKNHVSAGHAGEAAALISLSVLSGAFPFSRTISLLPVCVRSLFLCLSFSQSHSVYLLVHHLTLSLPLPVYRCLSLSVSLSFPLRFYSLPPSPFISLSLHQPLTLTHLRSHLLPCVPSLSHILARGFVAPPVSCLIKSFCLYLKMILCIPEALHEDGPQGGPRDFLFMSDIKEE